jgi:hypothetical protein
VIGLPCADLYACQVWLSDLGNFTAAMFNRRVNEDGVMTAETRSRDLSAIFAALADPIRWVGSRASQPRVKRPSVTIADFPGPL